MGNIISVADISHAYLLQVAEPFHQREIVSQSLAGMFQVAERVDHRHAGSLGHSFDGAMRISPKHNGVDPALHVVRDVAQLFPSIKTSSSLVHEKRVAAHAGHPGLER